MGTSNIKSLVEGNYSLNGEVAKPLAIGSNSNRLIKDGDFNIGIDHNTLREGDNFVKVTVFQKDNNTELVSKTVTIDYTHGNTWPFPYTADWGQITDIQDVGRIGQIVDGLWELDSEGIRVVTGHKGYDLTIAIGDKTWPTDYEVTVPFTLHSNSYRGIGFAFGWQGHTGSENPPKQWPLQALAWVRQGHDLEIVTYDGPKTPTGGWEKSEIKQPLAEPVRTGRYFIKARSKSIENTNLSRIHVKFWAQRDSEPATWMISADVPTRNGSVLLVAYDVDITFGNVTIDALDGVVPPDSTPPIISNILNQTSDTTAFISWDTNEASDSNIDFGFDSNYQWSARDDALVLNHRVTLSDLVADSQYNFQVTSIDNTGNTTSSENFLFSTTNNGSGASGLVSDEFGGALNTDVWEIYDPLADSDFSTTSTQFEISVLEGVTHNLWNNALDAPRIRQNVINTDFQIEVKFDSDVSSKYQMQGITVEQDDNNLLRFDFFSDGSKTYLFSASFINGKPTEQFNAEIAIDTPSYLRIKRSGNQWFARYSTDGLNWITAGSYTYNIAASKVGVFAGNVENGSSPAPAHTISIDYFNIIAPSENDDPEPDPGNTISDEFEGEFDRTIWSVYAPLGDSNITTTGTQVQISVPAGTRHDLWTDNLNAPRITQSISNTDFELEAKFDSTVTAKYQMQGIIVEEDPNNLLRFEFHSDGATTNVFLASIANGQAKQQLIQSIDTGSPLFLKVTRSGDQWTTSYAYDESEWVNVGSFTHSITANAAGLFAGNSGDPAPAHNAVIDYFRVSISAIDNPDPGIDPVQPIDPGSAISDDFEGVLDGNIWSTYTPLGDSIISTTGTQVEISVPAGNSHDLWTNNLNAPRITQPISNTDFELEAKFDSTVTAKYQMQGIIVEEDHNNLLRFEFHSEGSTTNVFIASIVNGQAKQQLIQSITMGSPLSLKVTRIGDQWTTSYSGDGSEWINVGSFTHNITAKSAGLFAANSGNPAPAHTAVIDYFKVSVSAIDAPDPGIDPVQPINPGNTISDDFEGALDSNIWSTFTPLGNSIISTTGTQVEISVPAGTNHDLWTGNLNAPRITQPVSNTDFELETKFDSTVTAKYQMQGIIVEEDHNNLLRFEFHSDGSTTNVFTASIINGKAKQRLIKSITTGSQLYLKVTRMGDQWTTSHSDDGLEWVSVGNFTHSLIANTAGLFAANSGKPAPAHTAVIDYFKFTRQ